MSGTQRSPLRRVDWYLFFALALIVLAVLVPLVWVTISSFRTDVEIFSSPIGLPETWEWRNYVTAWTEGNFGRYFVNSLVVAVGATFVTALVAAPAGYQFARSTYRHINTVFYVYLAGMTLPLQAIIVPVFYQLRYYGLLNTRLGLVLVLVGTGMPFACFLMRNYFRDLPKDIFEAAEVDGASPWRMFFKIALPLAKPALQALAVFTFLIAWNEYLLALLVLLSENARTIPLGLVRFQEAHSANFGALFAGIVMAMVPSIVLYTALQRSFTRGISAGSTKA